MAVKRLKPDTPSRRYMSVSTFEEITRNRPEYSLTTPIRKTGGRNHHGKITSRRRGGGHKRRYRIIDFKRNKFDIKGEILSVEYDPNRSSRIALVKYTDNEKRYIIAPEGLKVGSNIISSKEKNIPFKTGNCTLLKNIPESSVSTVELFLLTIKNLSSIDNTDVFNSVLVPSTTKSPMTLVVFESKNTVFEPAAPVPVLIV